MHINIWVLRTEFNTKVYQGKEGNNFSKGDISVGISWQCWWLPIYMLVKEIASLFQLLFPFPTMKLVCFFIVSAWASRVPLDTLNIQTDRLQQTV